MATAKKPAAKKTAPAPKVAAAKKAAAKVSAKTATQVANVPEPQATAPSVPPSTVAAGGLARHHPVRSDWAFWGASPWQPLRHWDFEQVLRFVASYPLPAAPHCPAVGIIRANCTVPPSLS